MTIIATPTMDKETSNPATLRRIGRAMGFAALPLLWDGFPLTILGMPIWYGKYIVAAVAVVSFLTYCIRLLLGHYRLDFWFVMPTALFGLCALVSAISSAMFFPQPMTSWLFALYALTPLLIITLFRQFEATAYEVLLSIVLASLLVSFLIILDRFVEIDFLSVYQRLSGFDAEMRRIVLTKNEIAFAAMILGSAAMLNFPNRKSVMYLLLFVPVFYTLIIVFEVRLVIGALLLALATFSIVFLKGNRRIFTVVGGAIVACVLTPILFDKYIEQILSRSDFSVQDASVVWRLITADFYQHYFDITNGIGFGVMSGTGDNFLAFAQLRGGSLFGNPWYGLYLADISLLSALYQFGYLGLAAVVTMELTTIWFLLKQARSPVHRNRIIGGVGLLVLFLVLNPWPLNMFTLEWCIVNSGTIWFLASLGGHSGYRAPSSAAPRV